MHELPILINITLALIVAFIGGVIARRMGLPTIIGYLLSGIAIGPFTPGFVGDIETIRQLAELGVIFLMFGVGLHFSFKDLWLVRDIAIPGALIQTGFASLLGFGLSRLWGWSILAGVVLGLAISVASTVVLLRGLMDHSLLNTAHGKAAVGWLVMEDILSVLLLVIMPTLTPGTDEFAWQNMAVILLKAGAFVAIMFFVGIRLLPWILERIAHTRSRELFILAILAITLGVAMGATELFGVSLALGAFMAGAIISQSQLSHQVEADVFPFREAFSVLFFVSIGMLVNPGFLWANLGQVISLSTLVVIGKAVIVILLGLLFPRPAKTFLVVAVGLSQIGEFSFILGQAGLSLGFLDTYQYSLILAAALISITLNPFMYKLLPVFESILKKFPRFWKQLETSKPFPVINKDELFGHAIVIGYGEMGKKLVGVLATLSIPVLVIEADASLTAALSQENILILYGDAANSEILRNAHLEKAGVLVTTVPDDTSAMMIVSAARRMNPDLTIIARASTQSGIHFLNDQGANHIVHPELEGGLELIYHTLISLGFPISEVHNYAEAVRQSSYEIALSTNEEQRSLLNLLHALKGIEIFWMELSETNPLVGISLAEANIRAKMGASVVALVRNEQLIANPKSMTIFEAGDRIGIIGDKEQIENVRKYMNG